ncbi:hypothetical protein QJS10_CPB14g00942 [Acorus calamus]|uniref:Uncharacterized protein n=1 Tax=Acorus calamus TaxID=4465 RepID=A0AAV9DCA8_ACOCL|nr:hypothetical protein QJS10_CPB14g00942 [Acorus calamus]
MDQCPTKSLIHDMICNKDRKPLISHLLHMRGVITRGSGNTRLPSLFTNERAWPNLEAFKNSSDVNSKSLSAGNIDWIGSSSHPLSLAIPNNGLISVDSKNNSFSIRPESGGLNIKEKNTFHFPSNQFESPYHHEQQPGTMWGKTAKSKSADLEIIKMFRMKETSDQFPNLQLSICSNLGGIGADAINKEGDSELKLSLHPPMSVPKENFDETINGTVTAKSDFLFLKKDSNNSSCNKRAAKGLSTLDLTMSIGTLE